MQNNRGMPPPNKVEVPEIVSDSVMEQPVHVKKSKAVEVMAIRPGFFKGERKSEGDIFSIPEMSKLGSWMKIMDPKLEEERQKAEKAKKLASR